MTERLVEPFGDPGLGHEWVRVAVRDDATTRAFLVALDHCLDEAIL